MQKPSFQVCVFTEGIDIGLRQDDMAEVVHSVDCVARMCR